MLEKVRAILEKRGYEAEITTVTKNGNELTGISLRMGDDPFGLMFYYNEEQEKYAPEEVADGIEKSYKQNIKNTPVNKDDIANYEMMKDKLALCVRGKGKGNPTDLTMRFWRDYELYVRAIINDEYSFIVSRQLVGAWGVTEKDVFEVGRANQIRDAYITTFGIGFGDDGYCLKIVTNNKKHYGALCGYIPEIIDRVIETYGLSDNVAIVPSSVHEVLIQDLEDTSVEFLEASAKNVNETVVDESDILGNTVLTYEKGAGFTNV